MENVDLNSLKKNERIQVSGPPQPELPAIRKTPDSSVYLPPHKLKHLSLEIMPVKYSPEYQKKAWHALRGSINACINKSDATNVQMLVVDLFRENLVWGRGLFCRSLMRSQMAAPGFSNVLAAIVAVVNTKLPDVGELLVRRVIVQFQRSYRRNDKTNMLAIVTFLAHLVNQLVVHELTALELLALLLEHPTDDSVDVAIGFIKKCGAKLSELTPKGVFAVFEAFRSIVNEGKVSKRVQYSIEGLYAVYRDKFGEYPPVLQSLDLVEEEDTIVHRLSIKEKYDSEEILDVFVPMDPKTFKEQEKMYEDIKAEILAETSEEEDFENGEDGGSGGKFNEQIEDEGEESGREDKNKLLIEDRTSSQLTNLRKDIYLTIMSSVNFEEAVHKLLKITIREGEENLIANMILDCCINERTFQKDMGCIGERLSKLNPRYSGAFDDLFGKQYTIIHRFETNKLRNCAMFFAHLLASEAIPWDVLEYIQLNEDDTTSSSRIFIKVLFQEISKSLGVSAFKKKLEAEELRECLKGVFPQHTPKNTRFAINFFTTIGLGALTTGLRKHLSEIKEKIREHKMKELDDEDSSSEDSSTSKSESSSESTSDSESDSSSSSE